MSRTDAGTQTEQSFYDQGLTTVAGVDEVGRGAWAGPLLMGAAGLKASDIERAPSGLTDSKMLTVWQRETFTPLILAWIPVGLGWVYNTEIDEVGMAAALRLAADRALADLAAQGVMVDAVIQDGSSRFTSLDVPTIVKPKADLTCLSVAAASVVAKVTRDRWMHEHGQLFPQHPALAKSAGYGTKDHTASLLEHGPCELHRVSFKLPGL